jgi:aminoglycoside phosphotransferase (APT) family kinase protein
VKRRWEDIVPVQSAGLARTRGDITPEWLSGVLGVAASCPVTSVELSSVGTGQMGSLVRAELTFIGVPADDVPTSVIIKQAAESAEVRKTCTAMGIYEAEVRFFDEIAPRIGTSVPHCYYAVMDYPSGWFTLVMEDLTGVAVPGAKAPGSPVEKAAMALVELARLQAPLWKDGRLRETPWLDPSRGEPFFETAAASTRPFLERFGVHLEDRQIALFERVLPRAVEWARAWGGPLTVSHGDFRLDNIMFAGGQDARVVVVDWQTVRLGPPMLDAGYYLGGCLPKQDRVAHERALLTGYIGALRAAGVDGYGFDQCWQDYRRYSVYGLVMSCLGVQATPTARGDAIIAAGARQYADLVLSLEAEELLP